MVLLRRQAGRAVLALLPSKTPISLGGEDYLAVLIPSAPVPFGGALVYVPAAWVEPAEGGIDELMSVYVSMGITPPEGDKAAGGARMTVSSAASLTKTLARLLLFASRLSSPQEASPRASPAPPKPKHSRASPWLVGSTYVRRRTPRCNGSETLRRPTFVSRRKPRMQA